MDPATAMLVATAVATAAKAGGDAISSSQAAKAAKRRAKETKRETHAGLFQEALQRSAELEGHRLQTRNRLGKRKSQAAHETADVVRGAFNI